jgi:hypothetical protein
MAESKTSISCQLFEAGLFEAGLFCIFIFLEGRSDSQPKGDYSNDNYTQSPMGWQDTTFSSEDKT